MKTVAICFVCLGNICRSPTAEGVMRHMLAEAKLADLVIVDSAGTGDWHIGEAPDERAQRAARSRGYDLSTFRGRQIRAIDFERFDLIIAMDDKNVAALRQVCPPAQRDKIRLLMDFATGAVASGAIDVEKGAPGFDTREVVDPYFGGGDGFETVLDQCEAACRGLIAVLRPQLTL
ncbi:low molecular weight phosphotyrosine protein phosphatase [Paraburkholderia sp. LEh10]|jgi:protein-tyrosine phosphatase|uniref:low molecular weight protein-tyrosine-phosphatase n=1 Tax=Paraburkholderia sp. LEh10 TaxID=2821353 RepID=UPI001AEB50AA|nr:low molecular weight protein-tyrosine-phosphatase [Paraburkholderia sp. LEh10]MBP0593117.1 low molecular weight phosphotyrosine protein phosphatase [Paraburkholderia sp. LEh10]